MRMSDNITVRGFVATEIKSSTTPGGVGTATFRMGSTERRYDRGSSTWVDGNTNWFTVQGYRQLAGNMGCSIKKGQRVIVVGRLKLRSWEKDGRIYHATEIDAESVGHDLMWGSANFIRTAGAGNQGGIGQATPASAGTDSSQEPSPDRESGDGDGSDGVFVEDANGVLSELDEETGELKGVAA
jgi:single-strand DNA-binding protein